MKKKVLSLIKGPKCCSIYSPFKTYQHKASKPKAKAGLTKVQSQAGINIRQLNTKFK